MAGKEATLFVVDVGTTMGLGSAGARDGSPGDGAAHNSDGAPGDDHESAAPSKIRQACAIVAERIKSKLMDGRKMDQVGLLLFGTQDTDNLLQEMGSYDNILMHTPIDTPPVALLRFVKNGFVRGTEPGDFIGALVVAICSINDKCKQLKWIRNIVVITDAEAPVEALDDADMVKVVSEIKQYAMNLEFIVVESPNSQSEQLATNLAYMDDFIHRLDGSQAHAVRHSALSLLCNPIPHVKSVKPTAVFKGNLTMGCPSPDSAEKDDQASFHIPVFGYFKTDARTLPSLEDYSRLPEETSDAAKTHQVVRKSVYKVPLNKLPEDQGTSMHANGTDAEVPADDIIQSYRFGKDYIPVTAENMQAQKMVTTPCLAILGVLSLSAITPDLKISRIIQFNPSTFASHAQKAALAAIAHSIKVKNECLLVRYVQKAGVPPKLGICIGKAWGGLEYCQLPFAQDMRQHRLASFRRIQEQLRKGSGNKLKEGVTLQDAETAMSAYIANRIIPPGTKDSRSPFHPKATANPMYQRFFDCVTQKALNQPMPTPVHYQPYIKPKSTRVPSPSKIDESDVKQEFPTSPAPEPSDAGASPLRLLFPIKTVEKKTFQRGTGRGLEAWQSHHTTQEQNQLVDTIKAQAEAMARAVKMAGDTSAPMSLEDGAMVEHVTAGNAKADFEAMVSRKDVDLVSEAVNQMLEIVSALLVPPAESAGLERALALLAGTLRPWCARLNESQPFNDYLWNVKARVEGRGAPGAGRLEPAVWAALVERQCGLITDAEAPGDSDVGPDEAARFWVPGTGADGEASDTVAHGGHKAAAVLVTEDLLDEL